MQASVKRAGAVAVASAIVSATVGLVGLGHNVTCLRCNLDKLTGSELNYPISTARTLSGRTCTQESSRRLVCTFNGCQIMYM